MKFLMKLFMLVPFLSITPEGNGSVETEAAKIARIKAEAEAAAKAEYEAKLRSQLDPQSFWNRTKRFGSESLGVVLNGLAYMVVGGLAGIGIGYGYQKGRQWAKVSQDQGEGQQGGTMSTAEAGQRGGQARGRSV